MAARRRLTLQVTAGMLVFGLLTFLMGLLIGLSSSPPVAAVPPPAAVAAQEEQPPAEQAPMEQAATVPVEPAPEEKAEPKPAAWQMPEQPRTARPARPAAPVAAPVTKAVATVPPPPVKPASAPAAPTQVAEAPMPAPAQPASDTPAAAPAPAAPAAAEPMRIADLRVGPPPAEQLSSPQRGALVQSATAPPLPEGVTIPVPPPEPPVHYAVQVARFLLPENARTLAESLKGRGYRPEIVVAETPATPAAPAWYLVVIDPKGDWKTAERLAIEVATTLGLPGQVVSWPLNP